MKRLCWHLFRRRRWVYSRTRGTDIRACYPCTDRWAAE